MPVNFLPLRSAIQSISEHRSRAALSATGIMVASVAIILLISIAIGVRADLTKQVQDLGVNTLVVMPGRIVPGQFNPNLGGQSYLKPEFASQMAGLEGVVRTAPLTFAGGGVKYVKKEAFPIIIAATSDWFLIRPVLMKYGSTFTDPKTTEAVAVIGSVAADELFGPDVNPVGKFVEINNGKYRVIGVTKDKSTEQSLFSMGSFENVVYIPFANLASKTTSQQTDRIMIQTLPSAEPKALVARLEGWLGKRLDTQQFSVLTQEDLLKLVYKLMSILTWLLSGLTSIALFVGGVGIMAVMTMAVNERTREIGVRKTVGAHRRDIFRQFLAESVLVSLLGGLVGLGLSYIVCLALIAYTPVKPMMTWGVVALAFGVCLGVGSIFGLLPAMRAAKQDPVVALRSE